MFELVATSLDVETLSFGGVGGGDSGCSGDFEIKTMTPTVHLCKVVKAGDTS